MSSSYRVIQQTVAHRYKRLVSYDFATVHSIINSASILHVSFSPDADAPFPAVLPMIGTMGCFEQPDADPASRPLDLYLHGHATARLLKQPAGTPVSVSAALLDGVVLALTPYNHNCHFRSAVLYGHATVVDDAAEKLWAMRLVTDGLVPGRWERSRVPPTPAEVQSTRILKVVVEGASAKVNTAPPNNTRADLKDPTVVDYVWTGVVPVYAEWLGRPTPCEDNRVESVPEYLEEWVCEKNDETKRYAGGDLSSQIHK